MTTNLYCPSMHALKTNQNHDFSKPQKRKKKKMHKMLKMTYTSQVKFNNSRSANSYHNRTAIILKTSKLRSRNVPEMFPYHECDGR